MKNHNISIVIPCYNEKKVIIDTIYDCLSFLKRNFRHYELLLVNDGSTDGTERIIADFIRSKKLNNHVKLLNFFKNFGKGQAVRLGCIEAKYENIVVLDADLSVRPANIHFIMPYMRFKHNPLLIFAERNQVVKQPKLRLFLGLCFRKLTSNIHKTNILDTQCPFKYFRNWQYDWFNELFIDGFAYDIELLLKAKQKNIKIRKIYVDYYNNRDSSVTLLKVLQMGKDIIKMKMKY